jgi:hypothetical protein
MLEQHDLQLEPIGGQITTVASRGRVHIERTVG